MIATCPPTGRDGAMRALVAAMEQQFAGARTFAADDAGSITTEPGAYALALFLASPLAARFGRRSALIGAGWHVYAGSARGPGGLRARLGRHFRKGKKPHWHVDQLTEASGAMFALVVAGGSECGIATRLSATDGFVSGPAGFGSSDCRLCATHLLAYSPGGTDARG